jgi:hypothetical protein
MKHPLALLAVLSSLAWAETYTLFPGLFLAGDNPSGLVDTASRSTSGASLQQAGPRPRTEVDCNSDNRSVEDFQILRPRPRNVLPESGLRCDQMDTTTRHGTPSDSVEVHTSRRPVAEQDLPSDCQRWPGGLARLRVRGGEEGTTDYGSAVCVGFGRTPGEWTFLSCSHNFESGGEPELQLAGQWVPATLLYRDKLAEAVETAPGQYTRVEAGPDRSVLVVNWSGRLRFRPVSLERYLGEIALSGYPSSPSPVTIAGQTEQHPSAMKAALERPSQGGFSGGGVFNNHQELVGIWTSGSRGTGYGHYVAEFLPIFRQLGWAPGNWRLTDAHLAQQP